MQAHADVIRQDQGWVKCETPWPIQTPAGGLPAKRFIELFRQRLQFVMPSVVVRRDVLVDRGMFDPELVRRHDMDMWLRVTDGHTWAYDPVAHLAYRSDTPGSVSRQNYASSEYWHLRMLLRHHKTYDSPSMRWLIQRGARAAMATALTDGGPEDRKHAWDLAWPHLNAKLRCLFGAAMCCPAIFAAFNRVRRQRYQRRLERGATSA